MDDDLTTWPTHADLAASSDVPANVRRRWLPSMWPPPPATAAALKLERCRVCSLTSPTWVASSSCCCAKWRRSRARRPGGLPLARMAWSPGGLGDASQESAGAGARGRRRR